MESASPLSLNFQIQTQTCVYYGDVLNESNVCYWFPNASSGYKYEYYEQRSLVILYGINISSAKRSGHPVALSLDGVFGCDKADSGRGTGQRVPDRSSKTELGERVVYNRSKI